jgi:hypothetical protein
VSLACSNAGMRGDVLLTSFATGSSRKPNDNAQVRGPQATHLWLSPKTTHCRVLPLNRSPVAQRPGASARRNFVTRSASENGLRLQIDGRAGQSEGKQKV